MKVNTLVLVQRGKLATYRGYVIEPHRNATGFVWSWLSKDPPYPTPGNKPAAHHTLKALNSDQLSAI